VPVASRQPPDATRLATMRAMATDSPTPSDAAYSIIGQYYDLIFPAETASTLNLALRALLPRSGTVVEIGPGTGLFTAVILDVLDGGGEVFAVEPSSTMRAALITRLAALPRASDKITVLADDALSMRIESGADAVVALNVITHFSPMDRSRLWGVVAQTLVSGGLLVVDSQFQQVPSRVPPTVVPGRSLGRRYYDTVMRAEILDEERARWTMTYRIHEGDRIVREDVAESDAYVVSDATLESELAAAGFEPVTNRPPGVLAWRLS
jgi:SAM-dependent methyltransferase